MPGQVNLHYHVEDVGNHGYEFTGAHRKAEEGEYFWCHHEIWYQEYGTSSSAYDILHRMHDGNHREAAWRMVAIQEIERAHSCPGYDV